MNITYDPNKDQKNIAKHGISLSQITALDWDMAIIKEDDREDYGEYRYRVFAPLDSVLYAAIVIWRQGSLRGISIRRANAKEKKDYENEIR